MFGDAYRGKRVFLTGHTGFKGAWLAEWLLALGAEVTGFSHEVAQKPSLFRVQGLERRMRHVIGDVLDVAAVQRSLRECDPHYVFHLAAQPLVRLSYREPVRTFAVNVMGTIHVLEAVRALKRPMAVVCVTSDKCYHNREWAHGYREEDPMGGHDPYSASKGACELAVASWRRSFFPGTDSLHPAVASARAGNVIGGGDWAEDRIVPDAVRAVSCGQAIRVRNRHASRPWQHVLEPLGGYLWLGALLASSLDGGAPWPRPTLPRALTAERVRGAFNFGPRLEANRTVEALVEELLHHWPGRWEDASDPNAPHEASWLNLATDKAFHLLGWWPVWDFAQAVATTVDWYRTAAQNPADVPVLTRQQIDEYVRAAQAARLVWATPDTKLT